MEILFENVYTDTEIMFREITAKIGMRKMWFWLIVYIPLDILYLFLISPDSSWLTWLAFLACMGYTVWIFLRPLYVGRTTIRKLIKYYDGTIPETIVEFGDKITVRGPDSVHSIPYEKITKVYFLKYSIVLRADKVSSVIITPTGFTKGTFSEFKQFLREKRPDLKIPD